MRLHTSMTGTAVETALQRAKDKGKISPDVTFAVFGSGYGSRSHSRAFEIQLGTLDKTSGPKNSRHFKNTGQEEASRIYAATYDEWGWFIAEIFNIDPAAKFGLYDGQINFEVQTNDAYIIGAMVNA
jgi:hypothetical protein